MCHKQCLDDNGYRNHCTTDGHLRQVALFSANSTSYLDEYSKEFEKNFMDLLRRRWRFKEIQAKKVYNEYIQDKEHTHMNATRWVTLTDFVHYLGKAGLAEVRDSEEGLWIKYIDRDPEREAKQAMMRSREKEELEQREIERKRLLRVVKAMGDPSSENNASSAPDESPSDDSAPKPTAPSGPISFSFSAPKASSSPAPQSTSITSTPTASNSTSSNAEPNDSTPTTSTTPNEKKRARPDDEDTHKSTDGPSDPKKSKLVADASHPAPVSKLSGASSSTAPNTSKLATNAPHAGTTSSLDSIMADQEKKRERDGRKDHWLHPNIVVKILNKAVGGGQYYGQKGVVKAVHETYVGEVRLDSGTVLKVDQDDLETVLPAIGGHVLVVNGAYRGDSATLQSLNKESFSANVSILAGPARGRVVTKAYEDICKLL